MGRRGSSSNDVRSSPCVYSYKTFCEFLTRVNLRCIIRAWRVSPAKSQWFSELGGRYFKLLGLVDWQRSISAFPLKYKTYRQKDSFPIVISLFSAPKYLYSYNNKGNKVAIKVYNNKGNKGAIMVFDGQVMNIRRLEWVDHPYWLPNFMDVFTGWILVVAEKVWDLWMKILEVCNEDDGDDNKEMAEEEIKADKRERIQAKIRAVGRMRAMLSTMWSSFVEWSRYILVSYVCDTNLF